MGIIKEFKEFAIKGNMVDMAVGIIVGGAFGKIVSSLVNDVLMPPIGMLLGGMDFGDFALILKDAADGQAAVSLKYGAFIQNGIDFIIVAFAIFILVKGINALKRQEQKQEVKADAPAPSAEQVLLAEIRDLLKSR
ncbi:MAG: large-conductance mechanosensitive channel protein MscL [bacterium]|nr:large-conductance mechanosensitive channel protein MscL [bacterium]